MVPVNQVEVLLLADAQAWLERFLSQVQGESVVDDAFVAWLLPDRADGKQIERMAVEASSAVGCSRTYQDVAVLGYLADAGKLSGAQRSSLETGLSWLAGRAAFVQGTPMGFAADCTALLGVALGAKGIHNSDLHERVHLWLRNCDKMQNGSCRLDGCQQTLMTVALSRFNPSAAGGFDLDASTADVRVGLRTKGLVVAASEEARQSDEVAAFPLLKSPYRDTPNAVRSALRLAALLALQASQPTLNLKQVTLSQLCDLLRQVPRGLGRWTWEKAARKRSSLPPRQWHVDNEYHIQNLLWLLLAPIFPDASYEDCTEKVGLVQPRADICIPSLRVIVEAKFMRESDSPQDMIRQIAEDASLYLVEKSGYEGVVAFVWDDSRRSESHAEMIVGMRKIKGVHGAIIVSRPGVMSAEEAVPTKKRVAKKVNRKLRQLG